MTRTDHELVNDALDHLQMLHRHVERDGDLEDATIADAVSLRLAAAIESVAAGSADLRRSICGDDRPIVTNLSFGARSRLNHPVESPPVLIHPVG